VDVDVQEARRRLSAAVFGNRAVADVISAINRLTAQGDPLVTTRTVANAANLGDSVVRPVMLRLDAAGLLQAQPRTSGPRSTLHYQVQRGELWTALHSLVEAFSA
jgi:DNA-binding GntR family transcriptional regulator